MTLTHTQIQKDPQSMIKQEIVKEGGRFNHVQVLAGSSSPRFFQETLLLLYHSLCMQHTHTLIATQGGVFDRWEDMGQLSLDERGREKGALKVEGT
jgi:hypothetical protein